MARERKNIFVPIILILAALRRLRRKKKREKRSNALRGNRRTLKWSVIISYKISRIQFTDLRKLPLEYSRGTSTCLRSVELCNFAARLPRPKKGVRHFVS